MKVCCCIRCDWSLADIFSEQTAEEEKAEQAVLTEKFKPLIDWLRKEIRESGAARDGMSCPSLGAAKLTIDASLSGDLQPSRRKFVCHRR